jgi:hypothetical protein
MSESHSQPVRIDLIRAEPFEVDEASKQESDLDFQAYAQRRETDQKLTAGDIDNQQKFENLSARKKYASRLFILLCTWITLTYITVLASGHQTCPVKLSDAVLIALITSGTVNIIGMFAVVLNYLFPNK